MLYDAGTVTPTDEATDKGSSTRMDSSADVIRSQNTWNCPVFLIGFMGSGKTTVGRMLARILGRTFLDTDEMIVQDQQMSITQIFEKYGEPYFRDLETGLLRKLEKDLQETGRQETTIRETGRQETGRQEAGRQETGRKETSMQEPDSAGYVISVGGGLPLREENRVIMKRIGIVIYLKASPDTLVERLKGDTSRPLLQGGNMREKILSLMEKRDSFYTQAAQIQLFTDEMSVRETARCAARQIKITVEKIPQIR